MDSFLLIGSAGSVGHDMMYIIASKFSDIKVVGADINEEKGRFEVEESLHVAHNMGNYPDHSFCKIDLFDVPGTAELLKEVRPSVICNLSARGSWWITRLLPMDVYRKISPIGPWLPNHLTLAHKLMEAVKRSGIETQVVNGAFPDLTNVVLSKVGLEPACGGGNMDLACSRIKRIVAREMGVPYRSVTVYGVGHHGSYYTAGLDGPYWLKTLVDGEDFSQRFPNEKITRVYNEAGARLDGIERVKDDGTVVFVEENVELMREVVGYECEVLKVSESEERARELNAKLRKLYEKYKVS